MTCIPLPVWRSISQEGSFTHSADNPGVAKEAREAQLFILVNTTFLVNFSIPTLRTDRRIKFAYTPPLTLDYEVIGVKGLNPCKDFGDAPCGK